MKDIRIDLEIMAMAYYYTVNYDNQKKIVYFCSLEKELEKKISDEDLEIFWNKINKIDVWNWKKKYESFPEPPTDGIDWKLKLRNKMGKVIYSTGYETYPDNFNMLMEAFDDLVGLEYDDCNRFENFTEDLEDYD